MYIASLSTLIYYDSIELYKYLSQQLRLAPMEEWKENSNYYAALGILDNEANKLNCF